jgi:hypothetical protein
LLGQGNDIWGWTDDENNEYVIAGCSDGSSFIDVTDPANPVVLGWLPTQTVASSWRDMKVFQGHVYIGSEAKNHGMQVFDLHELTALSKKYRSSANSNSTAVHSVQTLTPTTVYEEFGSSHNIVINEQSGYLYAVGTKTCAGGLHIVDIHNPADPQFVGTPPPHPPPFPSYVSSDLGQVATLTTVTLMMLSVWCTMVLTLPMLNMRSVSITTKTLSLSLMSPTRIPLNLSLGTSSLASLGTSPVASPLSFQCLTSHSSSFPLATATQVPNTLTKAGLMPSNPIS